MIVNVCPAATTSAPPDRVWSVLVDAARIHEWTDASFVSAVPPGPMKAGQIIHLAASGFGRNWPMLFDVQDVDPRRRWLDLVVQLPLGLVNHERITLTETPEGGTLVRFN